MAKVLSVKQPWAHAIVSGIKDIENRPRRTNVRGTVLIHASQSLHMNYGVFSYEQSNQIKLMPKFSELNKSAIIGTVDIIDCVNDHPSIWADPNSWNYVLANPVLFEAPIQNVKGKLGFWDFDYIIHGFGNSKDGKKPLIEVVWQEILKNG